MAKGFGGGMPGNMQQIMQQAKKMQDDIKKAKEEVKELTAEASSGGGMVKATANGENLIVSVAIDKEVVNPDDVEMLQDLVVAACNEALGKIQKQVEERLVAATGGMNIPGLI